MATQQKSKRLVRRSVKKAVAKRPIQRAAARPRTNGSARSHAVASRRQPETLRLRSVMPSYTVNDIQKSVAWYCDGLGFVVSERWEEGGKLEGVMLKAGNITFGLSQDDFGKGRDREKGVGFRIYADTVQSVDALADRIRAYGGKIITEPTDMPWGARSFAVEDPDGFRISFSEPR
jgi:lactoylglutathione lyase